jgi:hypothetical protein
MRLVDMVRKTVLACARKAEAWATRDWQGDERDRAIAQASIEENATDRIPRVTAMKPIPEGMPKLGVEQSKPNKVRRLTVTSDGPDLAIALPMGPGPLRTRRPESVARAARAAARRQGAKILG